MLTITDIFYIISLLCLLFVHFKVVKNLTGVIEKLACKEKDNKLGLEDIILPEYSSIGLTDKDEFDIEQERLKNKETEL